jgi:hypothetical protein
MIALGGKKSGSNSAVECQLPKLDVAGSIPVSRSIFSTVCTNRLHSVLRLCSDYITCKLFSSWLTAASLLSTGDCVYTFWFTSRLWPS